MGAPRFVLDRFWPSSLFLGGIPGAWYDPTDLSTMFQDSAGTTPVTAVEQPVGLILDKKMPYTSVGYRSIVFDGTGDYLTLGGQSAFAWGTGDFTIEFWFYTTNAAAVQTLIETRPTGTGSTSQYFSIAYLGGAVNYYTANLVPAIAGVAVPINTWTHVAVCRSGTSTRLFINGTQAGSTYVDTQDYLVGASRPIIGADGNSPAAQNLAGSMSNIRIVKGTALYTANFTPSTVPLVAVAGTSLLTGQNATIVDNSPSAFAITVNGNTTTGWDSPFGANARQSTAASRPTYRARYNALTQSETFTGAPWLTGSTSGAITRSTISTQDPTGATSNVSTVAFPAVPAGQFSIVYQDSGATYLNVNVTWSVWLRVASGTATIYLNVEDTAAGPGAGNFFASPALTLTTTWQRFTLTGTRTASTGNLGVFFGFDTRASAGQTNAAPLTVQVWGAQLLTAADVTATGNAYQRIAAATVYDTAPIFRPYLAFDGVDDSLSTAAINFTSTDKMTVFAGGTKLQDATLGVLAELSTDAPGTNGTFWLLAPYTATERYSALSRGTSFTLASSSSALDVSPNTSVLTARLDIAAPLTQLIVNRAVRATNTASQGTGNYGNWPLFIGRRNNASFPFNGRLFSLIVRGAASSTTEIADTELWVNARTGAF